MLTLLLTVSFSLYTFSWVIQESQNHVFFLITNHLILILSPKNLFFYFLSLDYLSFCATFDNLSLLYHVLDMSLDYNYLSAKANLVHCCIQGIA